MSIHQCTIRNKLALVRMGWDRPMQGFFMTVEKNGETLFDNLEQEEPFPKGINDYLAKLKQMGIDLPQKMIYGVLADGIHNVGNKFVLHVHDG